VHLEQTLKISLFFGFQYFIYSVNPKEDSYFFRSIFMNLFDDALIVHFYLFGFFSAEHQVPFIAYDEAFLPVAQ
jgi:hypothetical protein